jgi:hypothetical protein
MDMNSREGVYMDIPAVRNVSKTFGRIGAVLRTVSKVLKALITTLKTTAFVGMVGGLALAQYLQTIKPQIDELAKKCTELSKDLTASIDAFERGDAQGATPFY